MFVTSAPAKDTMKSHSVLNILTPECVGENALIYSKLDMSCILQDEFEAEILNLCYDQYSPAWTLCPITPPF